MSYLPSVEEIYVEFFRESSFARMGFYPRTPKNFDKVITSERRILLEKFRSFVARANGTVDWKMYIKAISSYYRFMKFDELASPRGSKIYREYLSIYGDCETDETFKKEIVESFLHIKQWCIDHGRKIGEYMRDSAIFPLPLKDLYSGAIKKSFYAAIGMKTTEKIFRRIPDDVFVEYFKKDRRAFLQDIRLVRATLILRPGLSELINSIETKFSESKI